MEEKKMVSQPGELTFIPSQCHNCINNLGSMECKIYGTKPFEYLDNEEKCPEYEKES